MSNNNNKSENGKSDLAAKLKKERQEMESDSREYGWRLGHELMEDGQIGHALIRRLNREWTESRGYEPWDNLHRTLGDELSHDVVDIIRRREMDGDEVIYDEVAVGFFEAITEVWADCNKKEACLG